jgi:6-pyruvoyltetrahydropterin/6-carboxytetrahydropterin synthase
MLQQFYPQVLHSYQYELNKDMHFAAAHFVPHESAGKCVNIHGHTYFVNVTVAGDELNEAGFLVDFKTLKEIVHDRYDHSLINDKKDDFNDKNEYDFPTTEVVARKIYENIQTYLDNMANRPKCLQVIVRETPTSYVVYRPKSGAK